jgi:hypothetical protein
MYILLNMTASCHYRKRVSNYRETSLVLSNFHFVLFYYHALLFTHPFSLQHLHGRHLVNNYSRHFFFLLCQSFLSVIVVVH